MTIDELLTRDLFTSDGDTIEPRELREWVEHFESVLVEPSQLRTGDPGWSAGCYVLTPLVDGIRQPLSELVVFTR